eukprot:TRINITY_DN28330_c0_g1_i1.p1 TRINITY_DN28330_c0_g1~~TRINITY_DN28330_c0_g1_i1.p1  ORF type:complete len:516 (+),score=96.69 TRINITY_DN28330_c0_g1_i1:131-1678(+)
MCIRDRAEEDPLVAHVDFSGDLPWLECVAQALDRIPADSPIDHLVLAVHGAGNTTTSGEGTGSRLDEILNGFQDTMSQVQEATPRYKPTRTLVLGVQWFSVVSAALGTDLDPCTPTAVAEARTLLRDTIGTILAFMAPKFRRIMVDETHSQLEALRGMVQQRFKSFSGQSSLIGYSLGGTIVYELLTQGPALSFEPAHVFYLGSNIGGYASMVEDGAAGLKQHVTASLAQGSGCHVHNIFHPHDPLAFRIEPAVDACWAAVPPEELPQVDSTLGRAYETLKQKMEQKVDTLSGLFFDTDVDKEEPDLPMEASTEAESSSPSIDSFKSKVKEFFSPVSDSLPFDLDDDSEPAASIPRCLCNVPSLGRRIDFVLPTSETPSSVLAFMLRQGQQAHEIYWSSPETAQYVLRSLYPEMDDVGDGAQAEGAPVFAGKPSEFLKKPASPSSVPSEPLTPPLSPKIFSGKPHELAKARPTTKHKSGSTPVVGGGFMECHADELGKEPPTMKQRARKAPPVQL